MDLHQFEVPKLKTPRRALLLATAVAEVCGKPDPRRATVEDLLHYTPIRYEDRSKMPKIKDLQEALATETQRREAIKQRAAEHARCRGELEAAIAQNEHTEKALQREMEASDSAKRRGELEAELVESQQVQSQLRHELQEAQQQLEALREKSAGNHDPEARVQRLQAAQAEVEQQLQGLSLNLSEETRRRERAEQQASEIDQRRNELEAHLEQLRQELETSRNRLQAQEESSFA